MYPGVIAMTSPDRPAVIVAGTDRQLTYKELDDNSAALARVLHDAGLRRGDTVALLSDNTVEAFEVFWATQRSGLYITAINWHLKPDEVAYIIGDSGAKALIVSSSISDLAVQASPLLPDSVLRLSFGGAVPGYDSYEAALADAGTPLADQPSGAIMLYSSGTTGFPKGVKMPLPDRQVDEPGEVIVPLLQHMYGIGEEDVYLSSAPIYHAAPLRWGGALHALGATIVMLPKFDAVETLETIERYRVTATQMVPTMFVRILKLPQDVRTAYDLSSLRVVVHAAAPCPPDVKQAMIDWLGPIIYEYYSSTEANGMTFVNSEEWLQKPGSVGKAMVGTIHVCDDDGHEVPPGEVGAIFFERDELPFTYHNDPDKTAAAQHPEHPNWTTVGDLGYVDEDGFLFLTDRKAFMIISGGVNIYPQEVENVLTLHPKVDDVAVIGIPDPEMGEQVKAVVQLAQGVEPSDSVADELITYVRERIANYKAPRSVDFVTSLPRTATGKLVKREIRETYTSGAATTSK
ncbi:AMP-binding protein [Rhodococcus aetherivorans]|uniref:AMP-binding protein n=1 Tax=Rhodococcus aetherivorans TaxID=191292 RepID=UPI0002D22D96|nr:AMP-binding protein [Rhodococcus aetherivorans]CCW12642.1 Long-chain-fatty-acid--CoA ligase [Rhodococcus aetherivorans]